MRSSHTHTSPQQSACRASHLRLTQILGLCKQYGIVLHALWIDTERALERIHDGVKHGVGFGREEEVEGGGEEGEGESGRFAVWEKHVYVLNAYEELCICWATRT